MTEDTLSVNGYVLHERIGSGGFGVVHRAYQTTVGREVAIKIILPRFANHPDFIRRFEAEAQLIVRLEHPYIVPLFDYWRDSGGAYLVMRWLRGGNLRDALQQDPFDLETTAQLLDQVTSALALAHRRDVIHRDIKPANILLDEDGNAYLSDFGIAKNMRDTASNQTGSDVIMGSPDYLSPEQARRDPVDTRTDIYSMGDARIIQFDLTTHEITWQAYPDNEAWVIRHSPNGQYVLIRDSNMGKLSLWDAVTGALIQTFGDHHGEPPNVVFSHDSQTIFSTGLDGSIVEWRIADLSVENLREWIRNNRYTREFTCRERAQYHIEPSCD